MKFLRERFAKEDNVWLDQTIALWYEAVRYLGSCNSLLHHIIGILQSALYAVMAGEASVGFYDVVLGYPGFPIEAIDVLGEKFEEKTLVRQQANEGMRNSGPILAGV